MVFESLVADILNRFLGDYVENLNRDQLKIGIWGGDVVLENLVLKQTALDDLDLPLRVSYGKLGKLVLKIPWKNLYGAPVEVEVQNLFIIAIPNNEIVYQAEKEEKYKQDAKQAELTRIENAKLKELAKDTPAANDTFVEKLTTQIIKNVQIRIENIHVRYEDRTREIPFAMGFTLKNLTMVSTDNNWVPNVGAEVVAEIFKMLELNSAAVYWNVEPEFYARLDPATIVQKLGNDVISKNHIPENYSYLLGPINCDSRLKLHPKPEHFTPQFSIPKVLLNLGMEKLVVAINKPQYQGIMLFVDSMQWMSRAAPYRKYRPNVPTYHGYYKAWWRFAYTCILETVVRRRRQNWDINHIMSHRHLCKQYSECYKEQLSSKKPSNETTTCVKECERLLDVFNIVIVRQRVQMEVQRMDEAKKLHAEKQGWLGYFWGSKPNEESTSQTDIMQQFEAAMSSDEKSKLYQAIGYTEESVSVEFPKDYTGLVLAFSLQGIEVRFLDLNDKHICTAGITGVDCRIEQRPRTGGLSVNMQMSQFNINGMEQDNFIPKIVNTTLMEGASILDLLYETLPVDEQCHQRIKMSTRPWEIIYDAETVIALVKIFETPSSVNVDQLTDAVNVKMADFKEMSRTGIMYSLDQHMKLELEVNFGSMYFVIPYGGLYTGKEAVIVGDLGNFKIRTVRPDERRKSRLNSTVTEKQIDQPSPESDVDELRELTYEKYILKLKHLQIVTALPGESWLDALEAGHTTTTDLHVLAPTNLQINVSRCLILDDPRLPKIIANGVLPNIQINIADSRFLSMISLATSIKLPSEDPKPTPLKDSISVASSRSTLYLLEQSVINRYVQQPQDKRSSKVDSGPLVQLTDLVVNFQMHEFQISISKNEDRELEDILGEVAGETGEEKQKTNVQVRKLLCTFSLTDLEFDLTGQTFNQTISVKLGGINLKQFYNEETIPVIKTLRDEGYSDYLVTANYVSVNRKSPEFVTKYESCEQSLFVEFRKLFLLLHLEGLTEMLQFINNLQTKANKLMYIAPDDETITHKTLAQASQAHVLTTINEESSMPNFITPKKERSRRSATSEVVQFKIDALLHEFSIKLATSKRELCTVAVRGLYVDVVLTKSSIQIVSMLRQLYVHDPNPESIYNEILTSTGDETLRVSIIYYIKEELSPTDSDLDLSINVRMNAVRIVFLNWFVSTQMDFLNNFQLAQQAIVDASAAAAESAKQNVQSAYEQSIRIKLNVNIKAPEILVPIHSKSLDAILIDLGHLKLANSIMAMTNYEEAVIQDDSGICPIIEEMHIIFDDMKLSRVQLRRKDFSVELECVMLEPTSIILEIQRNLTPSQYKHIPDVDINGKLEKIELNLSHMDYGMIMLALTQNLTEGDVHQKPTASKSQVSVQKPSEKLSVQSRISQFQERGTPSYETNNPLTELNDKVNIFLKFSFTMDSLVVNLFSVNHELLPSHAAGMTHRDIGLAKFNMNILSVKGRILSDSTIVTSVVLVDCVLDDIRPKRSANAITRMLKRRTSYKGDKKATPGPEGPSKSMIDITYQQKGNDMFVDVRVFSMDIIVATDYMLTLANFFTNDIVGANEEVVKSQVVIAKASSHTMSQAKLKKVTQEVIDAPVTSMTINLRMEQPDIVLVETTDQRDIDAVVCNCEILMKARIAGEHQVINGSIKDLEIFSCKFQRKNRKETMYSILRPLSISLAGSTPAGDPTQGLHLDVIVTDVVIRVSPHIIEQMNRIIAAVSAAEGAGDKLPAIGDFVHEDLWDQVSFVESDFWFLKAEEGLEIDEDWYVAKTPTPAAKLNEMCLVNIPSIVVTVEAGVKNQTLPMILLESKVQATIGNWSSQMYVDASLNLQMGYYNSKLAVWEPLIEPNEYYNEAHRFVAPWELKFEMVMKEQEDLMSTTNVEDQEPATPASSQCILISSKDNLEITVTKECLNVIDNLTKAFTTAIQLPQPVEEHTNEEEGDSEFVSASPFRVVNDTGLSITVMLYSSPFTVANSEDDYKEVLIEEGGEVALDFRNKDNTVANNAIIDYHRLMGPAKESTSRTGTEFTASQQTIYIKVEGSRQGIALPIIRADKRYFPVTLDDTNSKWGIISDITVQNGTTVITIRSVVEIQNHFDQEIQIYHLTDSGKQVEMIKTVEANSTCNLPLHVVHTGTSELFFGVSGYSITSNSFAWKNLHLSLAMAELLECRPKDKKHSKNGFFIQVTGELEQVYNEISSKFTMASVGYTIHLYPAVSFRNCLPYPIVLCISGSTAEKPVQPGELVYLPTVQPDHTNIVVRIDDYLEKTWSCNHVIHHKTDEFTVWSFNSYDSVCQMVLDLGVMTQFKHGCIILSLYCPFWMINKTGLMLTYRTNTEDSLNVLYHPENFKGPVMFAFNSKNFFGKKKASIRVEDGEWSSRFSLDVAGSSGVVACKCGERLYQIGVQNQLTYNGLSKQIVFTPLYILLNNAPFAIEAQEVDRPGDPWMTLENQSCVPLWPRSIKDDKLLRLRIAGTKEVSAPFLITEVHSTLLKMANKFGGINVEVHMQEGANYINLSCYRPGMSPGIIINQTEYSIKFWEQESLNIRTLDSFKCMHYTWENPTGKRTLVWDSGQKAEVENDLRRDDLGEIFVLNEATDKFVTIYWVSFLDGLQRVLLFTDQKQVAENAQTAGELEPITQEINVSIHGIGISLVNNVIRKEIMYMGIASSGIIWETAKHSSDRFKPLSMADSQMIESAYNHYLDQIQLQTSTSPVIINQKYEVDFITEMMLKPSRKRLRRSFQTGLWAQIKTSAHQLQLHAKINRLQIDNQLYDCVFPVVLAPVPPPKSVAAKNALKPFVELSIVQRIMKHSNVQQFKYFSILVQEFHIKLDLGFINAIMHCVEPKELPESETLEYFKKDLSLVDEPLQSHVSIQSANDATNFYDLLHFSPLKIHVSFSLQAGSQDGAEDSQAPEYLSVLLQGIGVTLTDLHDVVFRLAYFERNYVFLSQKKLMEEASLHYLGQLVKQLYVLVLGLDVIGNPYGLVLGITKGVEDLFYEPFQGAIQGPGEFAEGLALGVRSLFGHTIGGAAGAVSRITGAMGKGIAALSFDDEYQRRRRDLLNKRPANIQEGLARGGRGLVMGVFDGVTGVFVKPVSGAKEQGVEGFFKGLGKGAIGLVARPAAGVVDFASGTFDSVKRAAEGEDITRLRPPRFLQSDGLVLPYCKLEAAGHKLLMELEKGKYSKTDIYVTHLWIIQRKEILLLTDKRIAYIVHNDLFGGWQVDWQFTWVEMVDAPKANERGIFISLPEPKKRMLGFFGATEMGKLITLPQSDSRDALFVRMNSLFETAKQSNRKSS